MSEEHLSTLAFTSLPLHPAVMQGIVDAGFTWCTPIQAQTLPAALTGRDIAGQAQTGTGKTAAFLVALYQSLRSEEHTSELQSRQYLVCRLLLEKKKQNIRQSDRSQLST